MFVTSGAHVHIMMQGVAAYDAIIVFGGGHVSLQLHNLYPSFALLYCNMVIMMCLFYIRILLSVILDWSFSEQLQSFTCATSKQLVLLEEKSGGEREGERERERERKRDKDR